MGHPRQEAEVGIIDKDEVPAPWGLIEVSLAPSGNTRAKVVKEAVNVDDVNKSAEVTMLVSVMRRLEISTAVFIRHEDCDHTKGNDHD